MVTRLYRVLNPRHIISDVRPIPLISTGSLEWYEGDRIAVPDDMPQDAADGLVVEGALEEIV